MADKASSTGTGRQQNDTTGVASNSKTHSGGQGRGTVRRDQESNNTSTKHKR